MKNKRRSQEKLQTNKKTADDRKKKLISTRFVNNWDMTMTFGDDVALMELGSMLILLTLKKRQCIFVIYVRVNYCKNVKIRFILKYYCFCLVQ